MIKMAVKGTIFDIQKFSTHDGYGIRTTVFFKGCNNRCLWCHNPESLSLNPQLQFIQSRCIGCGECVRVCKHDVFQPDGTIAYDKCVHCGDCAVVCCTKARELVGKEMDVDEVFSVVNSDKEFYDNSNGGVTFSGGEPMLQIEYLEQLAKKCRENGIDVCVQTACNVPYEYFQTVMPYVNTFMCDFKIFDEVLHKKYVGASNIRIKENLQRLSNENINLIVRTPVIGGVNDSETEIENICKFICNFKNLDYYELLRYHAYGLGKLAGFHMDFGQEFDVPSTEAMQKFTNIAKKYIKRVKSCVSSLEEHV